MTVCGSVRVPIPRIKKKTLWNAKDTLAAATPVGSKSSTWRASSSNSWSPSSFVPLFFAALALVCAAVAGFSCALQLTRVSSRFPFMTFSSFSLSRWINRSCNSSLCCRQLSFNSLRFFVKLLLTKNGMFLNIPLKSTRQEWWWLRGYVFHKVSRNEESHNLKIITYPTSRCNSCLEELSLSISVSRFFFCLKIQTKYLFCWVNATAAKHSLVTSMTSSVCSTPVRCLWWSLLFHLTVASQESDPLLKSPRPAHWLEIGPNNKTNKHNTEKIMWKAWGICVQTPEVGSPFQLQNRIWRIKQKNTFWRIVILGNVRYDNWKIYPLFTPYVPCWLSQFLRLIFTNCRHFLQTCCYSYLPLLYKTSSLVL